MIPGSESLVFGCRGFSDQETMPGLRCRAEEVQIYVLVKALQVEKLVACRVPRHRTLKPN